MIPLPNENYVPTPYYNDVKTILEQKQFFPILVTGPSGIGKTETILQICANLQKEMYRINITIEADEDALMGGFRLKNGETIFHKGPVIEAMERGGILLLDELDLGSPTKIMCLQSVLEGKGYYIKRINTWVTPAPGFNVIATSNTKGLGDDSGQYIGTQLMNEASLDRFPITFEATYPSKSTEKKILMQYKENMEIDISTENIDILLTFANNIRKTIETSQEISYNISTRRLIDILRAFKIYGDLEKALVLCTNRFDEYHKTAYLKSFRALLPSDDQKKDSQVNYKKIKAFK